MRALLYRLLSAIFFLNIACSPGIWYIQRTPIVPSPAIYRQWWREIAECLGMAGDYSKVRFYSNPSHLFTVRDITTDGDTVEVKAIGVHSYMDRPFGKVFDVTKITVALPYILHEGIVKHEMAHAILHQQAPSIHGHPQPYGTKCNLPSWYDTYRTRD